MIESTILVDIAKNILSNAIFESLLTQVKKHLEKENPKEDEIVHLLQTNDKFINEYLNITNNITINGNFNTVNINQNKQINCNELKKEFLNNLEILNKYRRKKTILEYLPFVYIPITIVLFFGSSFILRNLEINTSYSGLIIILLGIHYLLVLRPKTIKAVQLVLNQYDKTNDLREKALFNKCIEPEEFIK